MPAPKMAPTATSAHQPTSIALMMLFADPAEMPSEPAIQATARDAPSSPAIPSELAAAVTTTADLDIRVVSMELFLSVDLAS